MLRYGAAAQSMRRMDEGDIFSSRLNLLIVMAKAFLKGYPLGPFRTRALGDNIQYVFYEALNRSRSEPARESDPVGGDPCADDRRHLFLQRAQLLAVMCKSVLDGNPLGDYRLQAMRDNIDQLCLSLTDPVAIGEIQFLKVA
jgi:hypothetical protein